MIFVSVELKNFLGFKQEQYFDLKNQGLVLVEGNNGVGKSSIFDAIVWCLFAKTVRGYTADEVINRRVKKDCYVRLWLEDENGLYSISRYRKHKDHKNDVLFSYHDPQRGEVDLSQGTPTLTQSHIIKFLGIDFDTFIRGPMLPQGSIKRMSQMTDGEQKAVLDTAIQLSVYAQAKKIVDADIANNRLAQESKESFIGAMEANIDSSKLSLKQQKEEIRQQEQKRVFNITVSHIPVIEQEIELEQSWDQLETPPKRVPDLEATIIKAGKEIEKYEAQYEKSSEKFRKDLIAIDTDLSTKKAAIRELEDKILNISKLENVECPTCLRPGDSKHTNKIRLEYNKKIKILKKEVDKLEKTKASTQVDEQYMQKSIGGELEKLKGAKAIFESQLTNEKNKLMVYTSGLSVIDKNKQDLKQLYNRFAIQQKSLSEDSDYWVKNLKATERNIESYITEMEEAGVELAALQNEEQHLLFLQQAFSNAGIKSQVLDSITPFLNQQANEYSNTLTDNRVEITFKTKKLLKSGESREKFSIDVENKLGAGDYRGNSGGEKSRADVAINLALSDLIALRAKKAYPQRWFDEPFESLDEAGSEAVMELLAGMAAEAGTIFVVTHKEDLKSLFNRVIKLTKSSTGVVTVS